jgi:tetratricopeptide (TPR) repeat protein
MNKVILIIFIFPSLLLGQQGKVDSLINLLKKDREDTCKVIHLNILGREICSVNPDTSIILSQKALSLAEKLRWKNGIASSFGNLGIYYRKKAEFQVSIDYYLKALKIDEELKNLKGIAARLGNIGVVYSELGDYPKSLDHFLKALKISEKLGNNSGIAMWLGQIGLVYSAQSNYNKALNYFLKALKIDEGLSNKTGIARHLGNIAVIYSNQNEFSKALEINLRALKINEELGDENNITGVLINIGLIYRKQGDSAFAKGNVSFAKIKKYPKALKYYLKGLKMDEAAGYKTGIITDLDDIGLLYAKTGKFNEAYICVNKALSLSKSIGAKLSEQSAYESLSNIYEYSDIILPDSVGGKMLNKEEMRLKAFYYFKKYLSLRDTIFSEENKKQLIQKEMNFDFEKKEAVTKASHDAEKKQQKIVIWSVAGGLLLVIIFAGFIFNSLHITKKQKLLIEIKNKETEEQKTIIEEKQKEIIDSITYAKRIQTALITSEKYIDRNLERLTKK